MSDWQERQDLEVWERMEADEYGPAAVERDEQMFRRYQVADDEGAQLRRGTYDELRELKVLDHYCPMPGCSGGLDAEWFCSMCGHVSFPKVLPEEAEAA